MSHGKKRHLVVDPEQERELEKGADEVKEELGK